MAEKTLTAQERAQLFAMSTRQNLQMLAKQTATTGATTLSFNLPKARLLSKILVNVKAKVKVTHASKTELDTSVFTPYRLIRRWSLDLNNGFAPLTVSGEELAMFNMVHVHGGIIGGGTNFRKCDKLTASTTGAVNEISFAVEIPVTLTEKEPIGLILLQNESTNVNLTCDIANDNDFVSDIAGATAQIVSIEVSPMLETFSIPSNANAMPDLSILKLVTGRNDSMTSEGQQIVKLSTGTIYRRILFKVVDENGAPMDVDAITSNIELVFNQADVNYSINAEMLRTLNDRMYGFALPTGMYVFDFAYQGLANAMCGTRDFIDTEKLTEFWLRFNTNKKGKIEIVTECLSRLI
jgi:hypothetical protein